MFHILLLEAINEPHWRHLKALVYFAGVVGRSRRLPLYWGIISVNASSIIGLGEENGRHLGKYQP